MVSMSTDLINFCQTVSLHCQWYESDQGYGLQLVVASHVSSADHCCSVGHWSSGVVSPCCLLFHHIAGSPALWNGSGEFIYSLMIIKLYYLL